MKLPGKPKIHGFTLVELLVVIAIIAVLAAVAFSVGPKMMAKAKGTESISNIRQIGPILSTYASEHEMKLPPSKAIVRLPDGTEGEQIWHQACLALLFPNSTPAEFKTTDWWKKNKTFFKNPLLKENAKPRGFSPQTPGYAMNEMIAANLAEASTGAAPGHEELMTVSVPLAALSEPSRTPLVAPCDNFYYRYDQGELGAFNARGTLKDLLVDGKIPVLFVDGHVESITPKDYGERKLYERPTVSTP
jgi:prepilin-type N-terminal cleavage/methylation domain-containing protein/prepilin-type processing-associated H-X9-DG protein